MEITHAAASFSPQVTRPATKASAHSAAGMQRLVRAAVQDTVLLLHGAIAGAPADRKWTRLGARGAPELPRKLIATSLLAAAVLDADGSLLHNLGSL